MPIDLNELGRLLAKATPRPWRHAIDDADFDYWWGQAPEIGPECLVMANDASGELRSACCTCDDGIADNDQIANARLIVAAVNALPNLIRELRELRADRERLDWLNAEGDIGTIVIDEDLDGMGTCIVWNKFAPILEQAPPSNVRAAIDAARGHTEQGGADDYRCECANPECDYVKWEEGADA